MNRKFIVLPKVKRRTLKDRDIWRWTQTGKMSKESNMIGKITLPWSTDILMQLISDRFETTWTLTFGKKEESK